MSRLGYLAAMCALGLGAWLAAPPLTGARLGAAGAGLALAVGIQGAAWWKLTAALASGSAIGSWIGGIAARLAGFALLWWVAAAADFPVEDAMVSYGLALLAFLLLEAGWLAGWRTR